MKQFVAVDGEGYTNSEGRHLFNLLGASDTSYIHDDNGLSTRACFEYLLDLKRNNPTSTFVSFFFTYDVNKILQGLTEDALDKLAERGYHYIRDRRSGQWYYIDYKPKKWFQLSAVSKRKIDGVLKMKADVTIKIYDTFGFFQKSFLGSLQEFHIGTTEQLDFIRDMKTDRSDFTADGIDEIRRYNQLECELLVDLMNTIDANLQFVGINLRSWHGAGAIAGAVLRREKVTKHFYTPSNERTLEYVMGAYFGGRVQAQRVGKFSTTYGYDLVSAYPAAMSQLASLKGCIERDVTEFIRDYPYAVYDVTWEIPTSHAMTPLPYRNKDGTIEYPYCGRARLWAPEIQAAMDVHGEQYFTIHSGILFDNIDTSTRPFGFIPPLFQYRKQLKAEGSMAQLIIKLALNSLYGKLAQGEGFRKSKPTYQCYIYAGLITSITRASIIRATANKESVISIATDGILSTEPLDVTIGDELGQWEYKQYDRCFVVKPGVYRLESGDKCFTRVRGFPTKAMIEKWPEIEAIWDVKGIAGEVKLEYQQFIGMKCASAARPHGQWLDTKKVMSFTPSRAVPVQVSWNPVQFRCLPANVKDGISMPYKKTSLSEDPERDEFGIGDMD